MQTSGPWTSHGHPIPGVTVAGGRPGRVARCGGPKICTQCAKEAAQSEKPSDVIKIRIWPERHVIRAFETPTTKE